VAVDPTVVGTAPRSRYAGPGFRHMAAGYHDPLSGEGARIHGGRFNPPDSFPVLYLCTTRACVVAEFERLGERQVIGMAGLLPRSLYRYEVVLGRVLDLTSRSVLRTLGVSPDTLTGPGWNATQNLGQAAHDTGWEALLTPSATLVDQVLAVFPDNIGQGAITAELVETWKRPPTDGPRVGPE
jgi:RES domain-containing protein